MRFSTFEERLAGLEEQQATRNPLHSPLSDLTDEELRTLKAIAVRTKNGTVDVTDEDAVFIEHLTEKYGWGNECIVA